MEIGYIWLPFIKCHFTWKHLQVGYLDNTEWAYFTLASDVEVLFLPPAASHTAQAGAYHLIMLKKKNHIIYKK